MRLLPAALAIAVVMSVSMVSAAGAAGAVTSFHGTFSVTPTPVVAGHETTFAGTGCLRDQGAPAGSPLTVIVDMIVPQAGATRVAANRAAATRAASMRPMSDSPLQVTPDAKGDWSIGILVPPDALPGDYEFSAVCDRYGSSDPYLPVTLEVQINLQASAEILLLDFLGSTTTPQLSAGKAYEFVGLGFVPAERVQLAVHSDPVVLANFTADPQFGFIDDFLTVPKATADGAHTLTFTGQTSRRQVVVAITVTGGSVAPSTATSTMTSTVTTASTMTTATTATATGVGSLASTGTAAGQTLWFGITLTLLGVATLLVARRRSQRAH